MEYAVIHPMVHSPPPPFDDVRETARDAARAEAAARFVDGHDDGLISIGGEVADVVLVGVSRTGKTSLARRLAAAGWRVANAPVIEGVVWPDRAIRLAPGRVIALTVRADVLVRRRRARMVEFRQPLGQDYCRIDAIRRELLAANRLYRREGWPLVDASAADPAEPVAQIVAVLRVWRGGKR